MNQCIEVHHDVFILKIFGWCEDIGYSFTKDTKKTQVEMMMMPP